MMILESYRVNLQPFLFKSYLTPAFRDAPKTERREWLKAVSEQGSAYGNLVSVPEPDVLAQLSICRNYLAQHMRQALLSLPSDYRDPEILRNWTVVDSLFEAILTTEPVQGVIFVSREHVQCWIAFSSMLEKLIPNWSRLGLSAELLQIWFVVYDVLNPQVRLNTNNLWEDFTDAMDRVLSTEVERHTESLVNIRELSPDRVGLDGLRESVSGEYRPPADNEVLLTASMLGYELEADLLNSEGVRNLLSGLHELPRFQSVCSSDNFVRLIEFLIGCKMTLTHLWTHDYINFYPMSQGSLLVSETGNPAFKTTHVDVAIDYSSGCKLLDTQKRSLADALTKILDVYAPINLVFRQITLDFDLRKVMEPAVIGIATGISTPQASYQVQPVWVDPLNQRPKL